MCWHFPRLSLRDVWACQCCNTILNLCVRVCVSNGEGVYLQFYLFWVFFISKHNKLNLLLPSQLFLLSFAGRIVQISPNRTTGDCGSTCFVVALQTHHGYDISLQCSARTNKQRQQAETPAEDKTHKQQHPEHIPPWEQEQTDRVHCKFMCRKRAGPVL